MSSGGQNGVTAIDPQRGDVPLPRFGHTTTYMGNFTVIMFGGAVGDSGRYTITNDTYALNLGTFEWTRIVADNPPSARAAHAATCVDALQFVVYGGATGGGSLSTDELYLLDLRKDAPLAWMSVPITGVTPGRRYGHSMVYHRVAESHAKANLIVFGGNDGTRTLNDIWYMDVQKSPFTWSVVTLSPTTKQPCPRVYHSAAVCKDGPALGMMVVFGGRTADNRSLRDAWGLRQHRDGRWDWVEAPVKKGNPPDPRFQHTSVFFGSKMVAVGGRDTEVSKQLTTVVYDTEACEWRALPPITRFRHAAWAFNNTLYTFGGFDHKSQSHPTADLLALNVHLQPAFFSEKERTEMARKRGGAVPPWQLEPAPKPSEVIPTFSFGPTRPPAPPPTPPGPPAQPLVLPSPAGLPGAPPGRPTSPFISEKASPLKRAEVRLSAHVHTKVDSPHNPDFSALVRKISIDRLEDEGRKIRGHLLPPQLQPVLETAGDTLADRVIRKLLRPNVTPARMDREFNPNGVFCLSWEEMSQLCLATLALIKAEPMVLQLRSPIKVYGDVHGQFYDLMRLFGSYKCPVEEDWRDDHEVPADIDVVGDIDTVDYLFLGDFVDRGTHSLEVIALLFALKCRYPNQIHLIRGNHEDKAINAAYGFQDECRRRLREDPLHAESCWEKFNRVFEHLPVGALIEGRILCIHGGIGGTINTLEDISGLQRPLSVSQMPTNETEQRVTDLLWSDPTDNDSITGVVPNLTRDQDGSGRIFKFGPDRVQKFLATNKLDLIIRAHECVMDGFERFAGGKLITLFSATDYCGHHNAGALLFIRRDLTIVPKIIYPPDRDHLNLRNTWLTMDSRPPTPPRSSRRERDQDLGF